MLTILTPERVARPANLASARVPMKIGASAHNLRPRLAIGSARYWRFVLEKPFPRYMLALLPFILAMLIWPDLALPISQAPVPMFILILIVESQILSVPAKRRRALIDEDAAARGLDLLRHRAVAALTSIAVRAGISEGEMAVVVEQSRMARVAPLTFVSVQHSGEETRLIDLDAAGQEALAGQLFDAAFSERDLQLINQAENTFLRSFALDPQTISAHARLEALASA